MPVRWRADFPDFTEHIAQRKHLLMQKSMRSVAIKHAIEKHQEDVARPSKELEEALQLAKKVAAPAVLCSCVGDPTAL